MSTLREWNEAVQDIIRRLWPEQKIPVRFKPNFDLSLGDISSECCILLAAALRSETPEAIAARIFEFLPRELSGEHRVHAGFINIRFPDTVDFLAANEEPTLETSSHTVIISPLIRETRGLPGLRLAARGMLQLSLLADHGIKAEVRGICEHPGTGEPGFSAPVLFHALVRRAGADAAVLAPEAARLALAQAVTAAGGKKVTLYVPPLLIAPEDVKKFHRTLEARGQELNVWCPDKQWMYAQADVAVPEISAGSELRNMLVYLATDLPARDLDPGVPFLPERSNLPRYLVAVRDRARLIERELRSAMPEAWEDPRVPDPHFDAHLRRLLLRRRYLRVFMYNAAAYGELSALLGALEDLSHTFTVICNSPAFRSAAHSPAEREAKAEIVSGVSAALSAIIDGTGLFSDRVYVKNSC